MKSSSRRKTEITTPPREVPSHATPELRIDPPHATNTPVPRQEEARQEEDWEEEPEVDLSAADLDTLPDWQRRQLNQLARLMRDRQMDLDRREAELNARAANFESQLRGFELEKAESHSSNTKSVEPDPVPPPRPSGTLGSIEETIRSWRRKWRGQTTEIPEVENPINDGVAVRLEKLTDAEAQLAQQWALLKNARTLQSLREKEFAGYAQKVERDMEQSRAQHHQWLEQEQRQIARHQDDLRHREHELSGVQQEIEQAFEELRLVRDELELAWAEIRVRIPSALRRRLDTQTNHAIDHFDKATHVRNQAAKSEIRQLLHQLELAKLELQEEQVQLEDDTQRQSTELRRARHELADREAQVRAQLAELRGEHESLNETKLEILQKQYRALTQEITPKAA